jgi:hypothetical protein
MVSCKTTTPSRICLLISFFLSSFDHGTFERVATVAYDFMGVIRVETGPKEWIYYLAGTNVANKNCVKFCMKEVFKCRGRRMMRWDEVWTKDQAWGCPCHPKKYSRSTSVKAWDAPRHPFFIDKYQVIFQDTIFLLLRMICVFLGASLFSLLVFFCFVCCNKWLDPNMFLLKKTHSIFHCLEHSSFHSYRSTSVLFFLVLRLAFVFRLHFCSELVSSL